MDGKGRGEGGRKGGRKREERRWSGNAPAALTTEKAGSELGTAAALCAKRGAGSCAPEAASDCLGPRLTTSISVLSVGMRWPQPEGRRAVRRQEN